VHDAPITQKGCMQWTSSHYKIVVWRVMQAELHRTEYSSRKTLYLSTNDLTCSGREGKFCETACDF